MVANIKIEEVAPIVDPSADLQAEIVELQAEVRRLSDRLTEERAHRGVLQRAVGFATARARALERNGAAGPADDDIRIDGVDGRVNDRGDVLELDDLDESPADVAVDHNLYVFDDEDESRAAFDRFFAAPDPHLDKVRGFLLD